MLKWVANSRNLETTESTSSQFAYEQLENEEHSEITDVERMESSKSPPVAEAEREKEEQEEEAGHRVVSCGSCSDDVEDGEREEAATVREEDVERLKRNIEDCHEELESNGGSDPVSQSKGSKVYNRTLWLTEQTEREQKLRAGAEKLLRAASSKRLQKEIAVELRVVNGNLQTMRDEMADIISTVTVTPDIHQSKRSAIRSMSPMIPLGLKETIYIDYQLELKEFISGHYHEDFENYRYDLNCLTDMRKACCQPISGEEGLETLFTYYNQLYFVDRRFYPANTNGPVSFRWYDSFTGLPCVQKTVGFEKGSVLFNIGILYAQKASKLKLKDAASLSEAIEDFQRSAGTFQYLGDNFLHAPSVDMQTSSITLLVELMLAHAYECRLEQTIVAGGDTMLCDVTGHVGLAQEAALVASIYSEALSMMSTEVLRDVLPPLWSPLATYKHCYHRALGHYHVAMALTVATAADALRCSGALVRDDGHDQMVDDEEGRKALAKSHLRQSILSYEEALRIVAKHHRFATFQSTLKTGHDRSLVRFSVLEEEDDFSEIPTAPEIMPKTALPLHPILPDFSRYKVEDLFHRLGCIAIFSARHLWTVPRKVTLRKQDGEEFGFSIRGDSPVIVATVDEGSLAQKFGMLVGDFIVSVSGVDIKWTKHDRVVSMIKSCGDLAVLHLVTPIDQNYIDPTVPPLPLSATPLMTFENSSPEPTLERSKDSTLERLEKLEKSKGRPSSASWKLRARNSRSDRDSTTKDKDGTAKDKDGTAKDSGCSKDKNRSRDRESWKDKDSGGKDKNSTKDKSSTSKDKRSTPKDKGSTKEKDSSRRSPFSSR